MLGGLGHCGDPQPLLPSLRGSGHFEVWLLDFLMSWMQGDNGGRFFLHFENPRPAVVGRLFLAPVEAHTVLSVCLSVSLPFSSFLSHTHLLASPGCHDPDPLAWVPSEVTETQASWYTPAISALVRLRQEDLRAFKASLGCVWRTETTKTNNAEGRNVDGAGRPFMMEAGERVI